MSYRRTSRRAPYLAAVVGAPLAFAAFGGCGPVQGTSWLCLNPITGKEDVHVYDANNYVNGEPDPCHCYDPCGPAKTCPIEVDAGSPDPGCGADGGS
jgi:hypothetical protein